MNAKELPEGWEWAELGRISTITAGGTPSRGNHEYWSDGTIPWVKISDITRKKITKTSEFITQKGLENSSAKIFPKGTILLSIFATLGDIGILDIDAACNQAIAGIKIHNSDKISTDYLYYYLRSLKPYFERIGRGVAQNNINQTILKQTLVPVPPLGTQRKIVAILNKVEAAQRLRAEADALVQDLVQSVFLEMFGDPISNPLGWEKQKLGDLCVIRRGASPRPIKNYLGGTVPWIKIGDGTKGDDLYISTTDEKIIEDGVSKSVFLKRGSLIFANCGVSLGFARIINIDGCIHDGWLALEEIKPNLNKIFLLKLINSISDYFRKTAPEGTQPNLNTGIMKSFLIPVPPLELQEQFALFVSIHEDSKMNRRESTEEIRMLYNSLLSKAFTGDLIA